MFVYEFGMRGIFKIYLSMPSGETSDGMCVFHPFYCIFLTTDTYMNNEKEDRETEEKG